MICKRAEEVKKSIEEQGYRTVEEIDAELDEYRRFAELGDARAQFNVGLSYFNGVGVGVDKSEGVKWFRLSAAQGDAEAQFNLGMTYYNGNGVSVDKVESMKWYRLAAAQGDAIAQYNLGYAYFKAQVNLGTAYFKAQVNLGTAYFKGEGVSVDKVEGLKWIKLAAENGCLEAVTFLEYHHVNRLR